MNKKELGLVLMIMCFVISLILCIVPHEVTKATTTGVIGLISTWIGGIGLGLFFGGNKDE